MRTLQEIIESKDIIDPESVKNFLIDKKIKVIGRRTGGHSYGPNGSEVIVDKSASVKRDPMSPGGAKKLTLINAITHNGFRGNNILLDDLTIEGGMTKEDLIEEIKAKDKEIDRKEKEISKLEKKKRRVNDKIIFMRDNGLKEFDDEQYKVYAVLQELKSMDSDINKAKKISEHIK